ncbi:hypothetical protein [Sulfurimonas sp.]|uniref:hypothetical protein n=1 Tax=Sulfurimonas sp. TaxID=2022749 RepID=UPI003D1174B8
MMKNQNIEQYNEELKKIYEEEKDWLYTPEFSESGFVKRGALSDFLYAYHDGEFSENGFMLGFDSLAAYSIDRASCFLIIENNKERFLEHFSLYAYYSYLTIHETSKACKCLRGVPYLEMQRITNFFTSNIIARHWDKTQLIGKDLINSLNAEGCIIRRGDKNALQAWFVIELFSLVFEVEINKKRALYPKDFSFYEKILEVWDSEDLVEIDKHVYNLCDLHLTKQGKDEEEELKFLEIPSLLLFPFEVLAWLRLREYKGFKNPREFTHPLMNEPITKTLLELNEPLEEPNEVPFLNEFLSYVYEHCPDIPQDEKYIAQANIVQQEAEQPKPTTAPKDAHYQATLPKNHPQANDLKKDPFAYQYYTKGKEFSYVGLEEYDLTQISWEIIK